MEKIRVAFFADMLTENFDGAVRTIYQIINRIDEDKYHFLFFCGVKPGIDFKYEYFEVLTVEIPKNEDYKLAIPALSIFELNSRMNEFNPNVIHISSPSFLGKFALDYGNWNNIPIISIYHTHFISYIDYYFRDVKFLIDPVKSFVISRNKSFYNHCQLTLVPSKALMEELISYDFDPHKLKLWRRGINTLLFSPTKRNHTLKQEFNITKPVVLFASRLVWEKNLSTLIAVYHKIVEENKFQLVVAGDGVAKKELEMEMPAAIFLGNINHEELSIWYASSDAFIFTSNTETYGNVVIEAMASGLPVVVADAGGPKDLVSHDYNGVKCSPMNEAEYYAGLKKVITDITYREHIINNGLAFAKDLSWDVLVNEYFTFITELSNL